MNKSIINGENNPTINNLPHLRYTEDFKGWQTMVQLLGDKRMQKQLWDQIRKMNEIRTLFNNIVLNKFKQMPKLYKKNPKVLKLFNDTILDLSALDRTK